MKRSSSLLIALLALLPTCGAPPIGEAFEQPAPRPPPRPTTLVAGDVLEVEFTRVTTLKETYRLGVGDRVRIEVQLHPDMTSSATLAPDGTVAYHRVGSVPASGRTIEELRAALQTALASHLPDPSVSVFLEQGDVAVDRFVEMLLRHPTGTLREVTVEAGGHISLPVVGDALVAGLASREVEELLNTRLASELPSLRVTVRPKVLTRANYTVVGEVSRPGRYALSGETTLIDAIANAGGETPVANLEEVMVVGEPVDGEVRAWLYDVETALLHGSTLAQVRVQPQDTVVVMRTGIGDVNEWIDQWVRRNIPTNLTFTYRLDDPNR